MRLLFGTSWSQIKAWQGWQFQRSKKDTYYILWDGNTLMKTDRGMSIANWGDTPMDNRFMRDFIRYAFEAVEIKGF